VAFYVAQLFPVGVSHSPTTKGSPLVFAAVLAAEIFMFVIWELTAPAPMPSPRLSARARTALFLAAAVLGIGTIAVRAVTEHQRALDEAANEKEIKSCREGILDVIGQVYMTSESGPAVWFKYYVCGRAGAWISSPIPVAMDKWYNMHLKVTDADKFEVKILSATPLPDEPAL